MTEDGKLPVRGKICIFYRVELPWFDPEGAEPTSDEMEAMADDLSPALVGTQFTSMPDKPLSTAFPAAHHVETPARTLEAMGERGEDSNGWTVEGADVAYERMRPAPCADTGEFSFTDDPVVAAKARDLARRFISKANKG